MKLDPRTRKIRRWKTEPAGGRDAGMRKDGCGEFESQSIPTCQLWSHLPPFTSRIHRALPPTPEQTNSTHNSQRPPSQRSAGKFSHQPFSQMEKAPSERNGRTLTNQRNHNRSNKKKASPTPTTPGSFHISTLHPPFHLLLLQLSYHSHEASGKAERLQDPSPNVLFQSRY